jgi:uncharacterized protein (TIGR00725 family)
MEKNRRLPVLAVLGGADATPEEMRVAERVGALAARQGWVVLTGGGPGVMAAASRGASESGGLTIGLMPSAGPGEDYPNPWVGVPLYTGAGSARNVFNVLSGSFCVAIGGGAGTLSEIAHALKAAVPLWCWRSWGIQPPGLNRHPVPRSFDDEDEFLAELEIELERRRD